MMAVFLLALIVALPAIMAQELPESPPATGIEAVLQPGVATPARPNVQQLDLLIQAVDQVPESDTKDNVLFWSSVAAHGLSTYWNIAESWKKVEINPIFAEPGGPYQGKFYLRGTVMKCGIASITSVAEIILTRKYPTLKRAFAYVNFGIAGVYSAQSGYYRTLH
jgi:hypothetical protein